MKDVIFSCQKPFKNIGNLSRHHFGSDVAINIESMDRLVEMYAATKSENMRN